MPTPLAAIDLFKNVSAAVWTRIPALASNPARAVRVASRGWTLEIKAPSMVSPAANSEKAMGATGSVPHIYLRG